MIRRKTEYYKTMHNACLLQLADLTIYSHCGSGLQIAQGYMKNKIRTYLSCKQFYSCSHTRNFLYPWGWWCQHIIVKFLEIRPEISTLKALRDVSKERKLLIYTSPDSRSPIFSHLAKIYVYVICYFLKYDRKDYSIVVKKCTKLSFMDHITIGSYDPCQQRLHCFYYIDIKLFLTG